MTTNNRNDTYIEMLQEAQAHLRQAHHLIADYCRQAGDRNTAAYIADPLVILIDSEHGFLTRDKNLGQVIEALSQAGGDDEDDGDSDDGERFLRMVERSGGDPRLSGLYGDN